ncbi:MAG: tRNA 4-thiouridine(8) synthase ThiI [Bacilli bacterium]|nr:tRNA 4-thiouridine(8) synthase ThiI [Bacilli bacterium]
MNLILIKYGELTTKGENREEFIKLLAKNIKNILKDHNPNIIKNRVRMYIECDRVEEAVKKLTKVFGIHGIVICYKIDADIDTIKEKALELMKDKEGTFKVDTNRADKNFPIKSMEFNNVIGGHILKNTNLKVDVHNPDTTIHIEIRVEGTYIYTDVINGIGGYPVGTQGKGLLMLSGGIDSPVAGYLALKRGIDIDCLYFEAPPHTSPEAKEKVTRLASIINEYSGNIRLLVVPFTKLQEAIYMNHADTYMITIMRRMMYRIAHEVSKKYGYKAIINGESIGQVASQTLDSMGVINPVTDIPVIRPVACMDKLEIIDIANHIDTYETSILPYEDCCTIFLPKHPVIKPKIEKCLEIEKRFDYESIIKETVDNIEIITDFNKTKSDLL